MCFATHNLSGEITYKKLYPNNPENKEFEVIVYTQTDSSAPADRPYLNILFGDENWLSPQDSIERVDFYTEGNIKYNTYKAFHTYLDIGEFLIQIEDPNRSGGVLNMEESINQAFFFESKLRVTNDAVTTNENSVVILNTHVPAACINDTWTYNVAAFDIDGDSLGYELVPCKGLDGLDINSWSLPDQIPGFTYNGDMYLYTDGTIFWEIPLIAGSYNIALKITEYSQGVEIGFIVKDFTIVVNLCSQIPTEFSEFVQDISVYPWTEIEFTVATDDLMQNPTILSYGGVLAEIYNAASFDVSNELDQVVGTFNWTPNFGDIREQPYLVVFNTGYINENDWIGSEGTEVVQITVLDPGVNSIQSIENSGINIFPNPTSNLVTLEVARSEEQAYSLSNSLGEKLISGVVTQKSQVIDISSLSANVYYLKIENSVIRLVKTN